MREPWMQSPLHTLGLDKQARAIDESCGVWANEIPLLGYMILRGDAGDETFLSRCEVALGMPLPLAPCTFVAHSGAKVLWLSPDEWLIVTARAQRERIGASLRSELNGIRKQVVDNSGGLTQVIVQGVNAIDVMRHVSVYDFDALTPGRVVGTTFGKASLYIHRAGAGFCLIMRRSYADYIWRYFARAAVPYGLGIAAFDAAEHAELGVAA
jgi:sarcosine oxidase, subunit gamma